MDQYRSKDYAPLGRDGSTKTRRWAVILAGGEGVRLRPLTRMIAGDERPKQFCKISGSETLLDQTRRRIGRVVSQCQTMVVVTQAHERFYSPLLTGLPSNHVIVQPGNLGTAPAILHSLLHLTAKAPDASVAFFPSDHYIADEEQFMAHVEFAFEATNVFPDLVALLGIFPQNADVGYGWIEPGEPILGRSSFTLHPVDRFWEKPSSAQARILMRAGCLWNSFVMVGRIRAFVEMIRRTTPDLYREFTLVWSYLDGTRQQRGIRALYAQGLSSDFSQRVLAARPTSLAVVPVAEVGWSDWGEPQRVMPILARMRAETEQFYGEAAHGRLEHVEP